MSIILVRRLLFTQSGGARNLVFVPLRTEIGPLRVDRFNQLGFLFTSPTFNFLLSSQRGLNITRFFEVHKQRDVVASRETWGQFVLVLVHAPLNIIRNARVKRSRGVGHDVNVIAITGHAFDSKKYETLR